MCFANVMRNVKPEGVIRDRFAQFSLSHMHLDGVGRQIYPEIVMLSAVKHLG